MPPRRSKRTPKRPPPPPDPRDWASPSRRSPARATSRPTAKRKRPPDQIVFVDHVRPQDVLMGRGPTVNGHAGNVDFRKLVQTEYLVRYASAGKTEKTRICQEIVDRCKADDVSFLEKDEAEGKWFHIANHTARTKAAQTMQDIIKRRSKEDLESYEKKPSAADASSTNSDGCADGDEDDEEEDEKGDGMHLPGLPAAASGYGTESLGVAVGVGGARFPEQAAAAHSPPASGESSGSTPPEHPRRPQAQLRPAAVPSYLRQLSIEETRNDEDDDSF